jgi:hypothetical protein
MGLTNVSVCVNIMHNNVVHQSLIVSKYVVSISGSFPFSSLNVFFLDTRTKLKLQERKNIFGLGNLKLKLRTKVRGAMFPEMRAQWFEAQIPQN